MVKTIPFNGFEVKVQFNPERIRSSTANVDAKAISQRPCFLCPHNLPPEQQSIAWGNGYQVLVNPFPIFERHLTVPSLAHTPQLIHSRMGDMLTLAYELPGFTVFYNGANCGASAPDHFHFQAGAKGLMPIERDFKRAGKCSVVGRKGQATVWKWHGYLRGAITIASSERSAIVDAFGAIYHLLQHRQPNLAEPMLNLLAYVDDGVCVLHVFPRIKHRPSCYFAPEDGQVLISPASVDMGGFLVVPRLTDFERMDAALIAQVFSEVCLGEEQVHEIARELVGG